MRRNLGNLFHRKKKRSERSTPDTTMPPLHVHLTPEAVASLPPPGLSGPSQLQWSPSGKFLAFISSSAAVIRTARSPPALYRPLTGTNNNNSQSAPMSTQANSASSSERVLMCLDVSDTTNIPAPQPLLSLTRSSSKRRMLEDALTLEERLRRERQRLTSSSGSLTQFSWAWYNSKLRVMIPARGSVYIQDGVLQQQEQGSKIGLQCIHEKQMGAPAVDPQLSPDSSMVAWTAGGDLYVKSATANSRQEAIRVTFGAIQSNEACISHGTADFVAQEEMDRYRGFWWHPESCGILLARVDESRVPLFRIMHQDADQTESGSTAYEDHRYPFAGKDNPAVKMAFVKIDKASIVAENRTVQTPKNDDARNDVEDVHMEDSMPVQSAQEIAVEHWNGAKWFDPPREASEYLARIHWLPDGSAAAQWQNRAQTVAVIMRMDLERGKARTLLVERSDMWINLHHMFKVLPKAIHPDDCVNIERSIPPVPSPMPPGSFSFLFASERSGFSHLYLYTFCPGINGEQAVLVRTISSGEWMVESIVAVDMDRDAVYFTGTFDSPLERHMYALPITSSRSTEEEHLVCPTEESAANPNGVRRGLSKVMNAFAGSKGRNRSQEGVWWTMRPVRLTIGPGMHSVAMDDECTLFADTSSDLDRPTSVKIFQLAGDIFGENATGREAVRLIHILYDASTDDKSLVDLSSTQSKNGASSRLTESLPPPELLEFPTVDGSDTLHAALYRPDSRQHGPGPYPLVCAVYGGPHVQRVNRSWSQCADMRAQLLRSLGFCVVKCDNRGSSRRGLAFESGINRRLGRLEVLDQVAAVRQLTVRGIADPSRVGVYGWSYGGYLAAMCLCRAPDVFHAAVAGAPVTSWDGYDTHYTERYMGLPADNPAGYRESAVFDHVPNMRGKLMIVHGLIDENVHFRHTARLINKLIAAGKDYDLLIFPDERHSPRRLRDRIYMEQRISDFFLKHLCSDQTALDLVTAMHGGNMQAIRNLAGHL